MSWGGEQVGSAQDLEEEVSRKKRRITNETLEAVSDLWEKWAKTCARIDKEAGL